MPNQSHYWKFQLKVFNLPGMIFCLDLFGSDGVGSHSNTGWIDIQFIKVVFHTFPLLCLLITDYLTWLTDMLKLCSWINCHGFSFRKETLLDLLYFKSWRKCEGEGEININHPLFCTKYRMYLYLLFYLIFISLSKWLLLSSFCKITRAKGHGISPSSMIHLVCTCKFDSHVNHKFLWNKKLIPEQKIKYQNYCFRKQTLSTFYSMSDVALDAWDSKIKILNQYFIWIWLFHGKMNSICSWKFIFPKCIRCHI